MGFTRRCQSSLFSPVPVRKTSELTLSREDDHSTEKKKEKRLKNDAVTKPGLQDRFSIDAYPGTSRENEIFLHKEAFFSLEPRRQN
jgi:hypothetical protein